MRSRRPIAIWIVNAVIAAIWRLGARRSLLLVGVAVLVYGGWRLAIPPVSPSLSEIAGARSEQAALGDPDCRLSADLAMRHAGLLAYVDPDAALDAYFDAFTLHPANASLDRAARLIHENGFMAPAGRGPLARHPAFDAAAAALDRDDLHAARDALKAGLRRLATGGRLRELATAHAYLGYLNGSDGDMTARTAAHWRSLVLFHAIGETEAALAQAVALMFDLRPVDRWRRDVVAWRVIVTQGRSDLLDWGAYGRAEGCPTLRPDKFNAPNATLFMFAIQPPPGIAWRPLEAHPPSARALALAYRGFMKRLPEQLFHEVLVQ